MKKCMFIASMVLAVVMFSACEQNKPTPKTEAVKVFDASKAQSYYSFAQISVPAGVKTIYLENYSGLDEQGHKLNLTVTPLDITPVVATPMNGKDVEPFGTVSLLFEAPAKTMVAAYYVAGSGAENYSPARIPANGPAADDTVVSEIYTLNDFPVNKVEFGEFGKTRYVQVAWDMAFNNDPSTGWQSPVYPKDVVMYDAEHDHTLRYTFAYEGVAGGSYGYVLTDAYTVENHVVTGVKYNYCSDCASCPYCMPWGCSCGCSATNPNFVPSGDLTGGVEPELPARAPGIVTVNLPEPAPYVTSDQNQTFYHSSGVVMFEDSWPTVNQGGVYDTDFDDVVIDYDFEAKTVADEILAEEGYREQVKVVIHLRAVGSGYPYRVGVQMEGFDQQYVESIEEHFSLDSWQNPHGELPAFTVNTIQHMSGHYETDPLNPVVEIAHIHTMNQQRAGQGADAEYDYINGDFTNHTVFNLTYGFKPMDESQYDPALKTATLPTALSQIQKQHYYNVIPGYINVAGGLVTYTVIYHMKPRIDMTPEQRELAKQNMINAVVNTTSQNFYIIADGNFTPVGLKGYDPVLIHPESVNAFNNKLQKGIAAGNITADQPYAGLNGAVWGFKCPTLTRHIWNKLYFSQAYPHYEEWVQSNGAAHANWYEEDINEMYLTCWW